MSLRLYVCVVEACSKIGMDAPGAEDAFGIERVLELLVHDEQRRRQALDAGGFVRAAEKRGMAAGLRRRFVRAGGLDAAGNPAQGAVPLEKRRADTERRARGLDREAPQRGCAGEETVRLLAHRMPERSVVRKRRSAQFALRGIDRQPRARQPDMELAAHMTGAGKRQRLTGPAIDGVDRARLVHLEDQRTLDLRTRQDLDRDLENQPERA